IPITNRSILISRSQEVIVYLEGIIFGALVLLVIIGYRCFFTVNEGECVLLTNFGKPANRTWGPGPHCKPPWHRIHRVSLRERLCPVSREAASALLARDGTPLRIDATVRYRVQTEHLERYLFELESSQVHLDHYYRSILRMAIANFDADIPNTTGTSFEVLRRERRQLVEELNRQYRAQLAERYGIGFNAIDLSALSPPQELEDALNAVLQAQTLANSQRDQAEALREQRLIAADQAVKVAQSNANAIREEMTILGRSLRDLFKKGVLDDYVHHRRAEILSQSKTVFVRSES
ncbi:MAG: SPFH domain-containing protein, partial [Methylococcales bacterium]